MQIWSENLVYALSSSDWAQGFFRVHHKSSGPVIPIPFPLSRLLTLPPIDDPKRTAVYVFAIAPSFADLVYSVCFYNMVPWYFLPQPSIL